MSRHIELINLPRYICHVLIGREHKAEHRMLAGGVVMICGVLVSQMTGELLIVKATAELIGCTLHAIGAIPILEWLLDDRDDDPPGLPA
jgi:hypothetical protein